MSARTLQLFPRWLLVLSLFVMLWPTTRTSGSLSRANQALRRQKRYAACLEGGAYGRQQVEGTASLYSHPQFLYSIYILFKNVDDAYEEPEPAVAKETLPNGDVRLLAKLYRTPENEDVLVQSSTNVIRVEFSSRFFEVSYVACYGVPPHDRKVGPCFFEDNELSGVVKSPSYPIYYPLEAYCEAKIDVPHGNVIRFQVKDAELCSASNNRVTVIDGDRLDGPILATLTADGTSANKSFVTSGRRATVVFRANCTQPRDNRGFHITYEAVPTGIAGGNKTGSANARISGLDQGACGKPLLAQPGDAAGGGSKIVRGSDARIGAHPWQVLLRDSNEAFCGGSLVSHRWVITAAHCFLVYGRQNTHVILGKHSLVNEGENEITLSVRKLIPHPEFNNKTLDNDIALIELRAAVQFSAHVIPICLGDDQYIEQVVFQSDTPVLGIASGWGRVNIKGPRPENLQEVRLPVLKKKVCLDSASPVVRKKITDNMFCAGYNDQPTVMDTCEGDSGGPFVVELNKTWFLVGIVSWSHMGKCGVPGRYGYYTKVNNYNHWITSTIAARTT